MENLVKLRFVPMNRNVSRVNLVSKVLSHKGVSVLAF
jgi:hypothetical protein